MIIKFCLHSVSEHFLHLSGQENAIPSYLRQNVPHRSMNLHQGLFEVQPKFFDMKLNFKSKKTYSNSVYKPMIWCFRYQLPEVSVVVVVGASVVVVESIILYGFDNIFILLLIQCYFFYNGKTSLSDNDKTYQQRCLSPNMIRLCRFEATSWLRDDVQSPEIFKSDSFVKSILLRKDL